MEWLSIQGFAGNDREAAKLAVEFFVMQKSGDSRMKVGFIGVGNIGHPMAQQILDAGFELVIHDIRREAADALVEISSFSAHATDSSRLAPRLEPSSMTAAPCQPHRCLTSPPLT